MPRHRRSLDAARRCNRLPSGRDACRFVRRPGQAGAAGCDHHHGTASRRRRVQDPGGLAGPGPNAGSAPALDARILPGRRHADAQPRFRHQDGSLAAGIGLEREVPRGGQRGVGRTHQLHRQPPGPHRCGAAGLRGRQHRHRARRLTDDGRQLHPRPSREAGRLRVPGRPRDDRQGQGDRGGLLRRPAEALVLHRLLAGGDAGGGGGEAVPRGLRRHRRRGAGQSDDALQRRADLAGLVDRQGAVPVHPREQVHDGPRGRAEGLRHAGRGERRPDRGTRPLPLRSAGAALPGGGRSRLPDGSPGRPDAADLRRSRQPAHQGAHLPGPRGGGRAAAAPVRREGASFQLGEPVHVRGAPGPRLGLEDDGLRRRHRPGQQGRRPAHACGFQPRGVRGSRREADDLHRLDGLPQPHGDRGLLRLRAGEGRRRQGEGVHPAVPHPGHGPLRRGQGLRHVREAGAHGAVGGRGKGAGADPRFEAEGRQDDTNSSPVCLSEGGHGTRERATSTTRRTSSARNPRPPNNPCARAAAPSWACRPRMRP